MSNLSEWLIQNEPSFGGERPRSLYSDLTQLKASRPDSYPANVAAWQSALNRAALAGKLPNNQSFVLHTSDDLLSALSNSRYGAPTGLGTVIDDSVRQGKMFDAKQFMTLDKSIYGRNWIPSPWDVLRWGLRQAGLSGVKSYNVDGMLRKGQLVLIPALEEVTKQILAKQQKHGQSLTERVMSREHFSRELATLSGDVLSNQDTDVLLRYLARDKQVLSYDDRTVKFKDPSASPPEPITNEDGTIASLKTLISNLGIQIANLEKRISTLQSTAQSSVKTGNRTSALSALRSKKLAEKTLQQRTDTLNQLEEVFSKIEQAVDQVEIVQAMESSAGVLRSLNRKIGGVERVDQIMDDLREETGKVDEVNQVLREPLDQTMVVDEEEIDDELQQMMKEEQTSKHEADAETTKQRLAELDQVEKSRKEKSPDKIETVIDNAEKELSKQTEQFSRLSIEELPPKQQDSTDEHGRIAETA